MEPDSGSGSRVRERGGILQEQDESRALAEMRRRRARRHEPSGFGEELVGEGRAITRGRPRHAEVPMGSQRFGKDVP
jgi:hypothetical protein